MNKTLMILSTHFIDKVVISEYVKMLNTSGVDAILAIDNNAYKYEFKNRIEEKNFYGVNVKCFFFDSILHDELGLPYYTPYPSNYEKDWRRVQWSNSDYRFYYVKSHFPDYDYYWQIEYDVFCNAKTYTGFLKKFENNNADLLGTHFRANAKTEDWCEAQYLEWIYPNEELYAVFFPAIRLSARAVDFLYRQRLIYKEIFSEIYLKNQWVHNEIFTATELVMNGFTCEDIENQRVFLKPIYLNDEIFFMNPDNRIYHPIKRAGKEVDDLKLKSRKIFFNALKYFLTDTELKKFPQNTDKDFNYMTIPITSDGNINYMMQIVSKINFPESLGISLNFFGQFKNNFDNFVDVESLRDFEINKGEDFSSIWMFLPRKFEEVSYCAGIMKKLIETTFPIVEKILSSMGMTYEKIGDKDITVDADIIERQSFRLL